MKLHPSLTTVTPLTKSIAMALFVLLPFIGGYVGYQLGKDTAISKATPPVQNRPVAPPAATPTTQTINTSEVPSNIVNFDTIKVGDKVGLMTVTSVGPYLENTNIPQNKNISIDFKGPITITGSYFQYEGDMFGRVGVCFRSLDENSSKMLPRRTDGPEDPWFCFRNNSLAEKEFGTTGTGKATITIDDFNLVHAPTEAYDIATLVSVTNKN